MLVEWGDGRMQARCAHVRIECSEGVMGGRGVISEFMCVGQRNRITDDGNGDAELLNAVRILEARPSTHTH